MCKIWTSFFLLILFNFIMSGPIYFSKSVCVRQHCVKMSFPAFLRFCHFGFQRKKGREKRKKGEKKNEEKRKWGRKKGKKEGNRQK